MSRPVTIFFLAYFVIYLRLIGQFILVVSLTAAFFLGMTALGDFCKSLFTHILTRRFPRHAHYSGTWLIIRDQRRPLSTKKSTRRAFYVQYRGHRRSLSLKGTHHDQ